MKITNIILCYQKVILITDSKEEKKLYMMRRVTKDLWKYHDFMVPIERNESNSNIYLLDSELFYQFFDLKQANCVCDILTFDEVNGVGENVYFENPNEFKSLSHSINLKQDYGEMTLKFYLNGSNGLSVIITNTPNKTFKIQKTKEDEKYIYFTLCSNLTKEHELFLAGREHEGHDMRYKHFFKLDLELDKKRNEEGFKINKNNGLLKDYFLVGKTTYDLVIKIDNKIVPCYAEGDLKTDYFSLNKKFEACFFNSEDIYASLFIKEKVVKENKIKVAILGTCFTKEAFHSLDYLNPDYKRYYVNDLIGFHSSLISVVAKPIEYDKNFSKGERDIKLVERYADMELSKTYLRKLKEYAPSYLLIDLYIESAATIFETEEGSYLTDSFYFRDTNALSTIKIKRSLHASDIERIELFKKSIQILREKLSKFFPLDRIVLIKARRATHRIENNVVSRWPEYDYLISSNTLWDTYDEIFEQTFPEAKIINLINYDKYKSQKESPLAYGPSHLVSAYYKDLLNCFNKIVIEDIVNKKK